MKPSAGIPEISPGMHRWFAWYSRRYIARHFNALRLLKSAPPPAADDTPAVYFFNHPSWWDPLVAISLAERFYPNQRAYGPIDAAAVTSAEGVCAVGSPPMLLTVSHSKRKCPSSSAQMRRSV